MLIDEVEVQFTAGHGGAGAIAWYPGEKSGPAGGNGGRGGDIYITVTSDLTALNQFSKKRIVEAGKGEKGMDNRKFGEDGKDIEIKLPIGTEIIDLDSGEIFELNELDQRVLICKGGLGGKGNYEFKSSRNTTPEYAQPGLPGQDRRVKLNLKLIADFGLIGLPNAGKSSLLNELTSANAKIGSYAFTTLEPNLGVVNRKVVADLPGLIEGASGGKGLGIRFLKHIEKVGLLLHCITAESDDVTRDYQTIKNELLTYSPEFKNKKEIILLTKIDLVDAKEVKEKLKLLKKLKKEVLPISIHDWDSIEKLRTLLTQ